MKTVSCILGLGLLITIIGIQSVSAKGAPRSAEQLRSELETALKANDTNAALALVNWRGVSPQIKAIIASGMSDLATNLAGVKLVPVPAGYELTNEMNGVRYYPNVNVLGLVDIETHNANGSMKIPYGTEDGAFYIAGTAQEVFNPHAKKSVGLVLWVSGIFDPKKPGILRGSYVYVTGGLEKTNSFQCTNNLSLSFWGDYLKSCKVTKISGDGPFRLMIRENNKTVFNSGMVKTNDVIIYKKK